MRAVTNRSRSKLWLGFVLMSVAVVAWTAAVNWAMGSIDSMMSLPELQAIAHPADLDAALANLYKVSAMQNPIGMARWILLGEAISAILFIGGVVITVLGMIEFAAEARARA